MTGEVALNGVIFGVILSIVLSIVVLGSLRLDAAMWLPSYPKDIRDRYGPMPEQARRKRVALVLLVYSSLIVLLWLAIRRIPELSGGAFTFLQIYATVWTVLNIANLVDLLVLDWLILTMLKPRWMILPGTDASMAGYNDYGRHFRGFLTGFVGITVVSAVIAGISLLIAQLVP